MFTGHKTSKPFENASPEYLRLAQAHLVCRMDPDGDRSFRVKPYIKYINVGLDEVLQEGYDPHHSPLGCPVYWRVIKRGDEQFYCSTFLATRSQVMKTWGVQGLAYCDPVTGMAVAQFETNLLADLPPRIEEARSRKEKRRNYKAS
jgi:hypothetical protein